jgi:glycine C-acetyltransferase
MVYSTAASEFYQNELVGIHNDGLFKEERYIVTPQGADIEVEFPEGAPVKEVINMCANNYLGLSSHPDVVAAAHDGLETKGYGMSSVRFICGTQDTHRELERKLTEFLGTEDTLLFASCMDANAAVFEVTLGAEDVILADRLVHASVIDGIKLCSAQYDSYKHMDMKHLETKLKQFADKRFRMIATDGVFSMDGDIAPLAEICDLAEKYDAMVMVDDSHASGFMGKTGRGTHEHCGVVGRVDVITTTMGKALGGASGGCISGRKDMVELCRQRARPYLFSNTLAPVVVSASLKVMDIISSTTERRDKLEENTLYFRDKMTAAGFGIRPGVHPIVPIMLYNAKLAQDFARDLYDEGIYVIGFFFPVVAKGQARIRVQLSAAHEKEHIDRAIAAFTKIGEKYGILGKDKDGIVEKYGL